MHQNCVNYGPKCSPAIQNVPQATLAGFLSSEYLLPQKAKRPEGCTRKEQWFLEKSLQPMYTQNKETYEMEEENNSKDRIQTRRRFLLHLFSFSGG